MGHIDKRKRFTTDKILQEVQATIFEPHRRKFSRCIFFCFDSDSAQITAESLANFSKRLTKAAQQQEELTKFRSSLKTLAKVPDRYQISQKTWAPVITLSLSYSGCLKLPSRALSNFEEHQYFQKGMADLDVVSLLQDPRPEVKWEEGSWRRYGVERSLDLMILVADNCEDKIRIVAEEIITYFADSCGAIHLFTECGALLYNESGRAIEPFGFRDGLSRIPFWTKNRRYLLKKSRGIVLDRHLGSYLVFRKLAQDKNGFENKVKELTELLFPKYKADSKEFLEKKEYVEAQVVGRFKDGTPLILHDRPVLSKKPLKAEDKKKIKAFNVYSIFGQNNDGFLQDQQGLKCPLHSHIRKTNPRDPALITAHGNRYGANGEKFHIRIARRGIPYQKLIGDESPEVSQGLLFMCYQANIETQFSMIQRMWCNNIRFHHPTPTPTSYVGVDPVIGRQFNNINIPYNWSLLWNSGLQQQVDISLADYVSLKGGEFFYTPAISWLEKIAKDHVTAQ